MSPALPAGCRLTPAAPAMLARLLSALPDVRVIFPTPGGLRIENLTLAPRGLSGVLIVSEGEGQGYQSKADAWNVEDATPAESALSCPVATVPFRAVYSADGRFVALPAENSSAGLVLWDLRLHRQQELRVADACTSAAFHPSSAQMAAGNEAGELVIWDLAGKRITRTLEAGPQQLVGLAFSPSGDVLVGSSQSWGLQAWDLADGHRIVRDDGGEEDGMFYPPTFSADGQRVALGSAGGLVLLHDGASGRRVQVIQGHQKEVFSVAFDPTSQVLASAGLDGFLRFWSAAEGVPLGEVRLEPLGKAEGLPRPADGASAGEPSESDELDSIPPYAAVSVGWTADAGLVVATPYASWRWREQPE